MQTNWYLGETKNYERFNFVSTNRDINNTNLKKIESSILEIGVQIPIVVNQNYEIIEGQHRFIALRKNKMVIPYVMSKNASENFIAKLQESKRWTAEDFCRRLATKGDLDCKLALDVAEKWSKMTNKKMAAIRSLELLMSSKTNSGIKTTLKEGKYRVNLDCGENVFKAVQIMANYEMNTSPYTNKIVRGLKSLYHIFNGLDLKAIEHMVKNNYITAYSNDAEQKTYMKKIYMRSLKAVS
tara:strand:- start:147 stop:866 length:720 start_codon:yes stop_codon:yes gene_type:complete